MIKTINGIKYKIKSKQKFGYVIYNVDNKADIRWITRRGWDEAEQFGIWIEEEKARPYRCLWYNGSDSDMTMMTREEFLSKTNQSS